VNGFFTPVRYGAHPPMTMPPSLNPTLEALLDYWRQQRRGHAMPRRRDIDPVDIPKLLANLQLIDVVDDGARFRYRLIGTAIVAAFGSDATGKYIDEILAGNRLAAAEQHYRRTCETRHPYFVRNKYTTTKDLDITASRVIAPLSEDGRIVNIILVAQTFEYDSPLRTPIGSEAALDPFCGIVAPL
jgi:hypothetical protein